MRHSNNVLQNNGGAHKIHESSAYRQIWSISVKETQSLTVRRWRKAEFGRLYEDKSDGGFKQRLGL